MLVLFLGTAVGNLFAQYLDVGDDPAKIQIASKKKIMYNGNPVEGYAWSHDGEWFLGGSKEGWLIMDKNGNFVQKLPRRFNFDQTTIFPDNKRIFCYFWEGKKHYYAIYDLQAKQETILSVDPQKEQFIDVSPQGDILLKHIIVVARKSRYRFVSLTPKTGIRQELGTIDVKAIVSIEHGSHRYLNNEKTLLWILEDSFKLIKYNFLTGQFVAITPSGIGVPKYLCLHDGRQVFAVSNGWDTVYLYEDSGTVLGKFRAFFDRGGPRANGHCADLIPGDSKSDWALAPNGKLIFLRMAESGDETGNSTDEVYLYNFQGKFVRFKLPYPLGQMKWSPQGDRMLNGDLIVYLRKIN